MKHLGLVWDLRRPPETALESKRIENGIPDIGMLALQEPVASLGSGGEGRGR